MAADGPGLLSFFNSKVKEEASLFLVPYINVMERLSLSLCA